MNKPKKGRRVTVRLPETLLEDIESVASDRYGWSISETIRVLLVDAVAQRKAANGAG